MYYVIKLSSTSGGSSLISFIGYGDFVYSFFSTVSYRLEGVGNWGKKFPHLLLDLCDHGVVRNEHLDALAEELRVIYDAFACMSLSDAIYDIEDLSKPTPQDLLPHQVINSLAEYWVTLRGEKPYLKIFNELISDAKHFNNAIVLSYAFESVNFENCLIPKDKGRKYWLNMEPIVTK